MLEPFGQGDHRNHEAYEPHIDRDKSAGTREGVLLIEDQ